MQSGLLLPKGSSYRRWKVRKHECNRCIQTCSDKGRGKTASYLASYLKENNLVDCSTLIRTQNLGWPGDTGREQQGSFFGNRDERIMRSLTLENFENDVFSDRVVNVMLLYRESRYLMRLYILRFLAQNRHLSYWILR